MSAQLIALFHDPLLNLININATSSSIDNYRHVSLARVGLGLVEFLGSFLLILGYENIIDFRYSSFIPECFC